MSGRLTGCAPSGNGTGRHDLRPAPATPRLPASSGRSASQRASSASRCRPSQRPAGPVGPLGRPGDLEGMMEPGSGGCLPLAIPAGARLWECRNLDWGYAIACGHHSPLHATRQGLREVHDDMRVSSVHWTDLLVRHASTRACRLCGTVRTKPPGVCAALRARTCFWERWGSASPAV
jgi:hypothetical protein